MTEVADRPAATRSRTVQMPQMQRLAPVKSYNAETRTVRVMWSAGARVLRYDWWEDEYFTEELDMSPEACDLSRLNGGAPVLDTHQRRELANQIGVVERAWIENGEGYADIRLSEREDIAWIRGDLQDGIIRNISVGYDVFSMSQNGFDDATGYPRMVVDKWQPYEISPVPVGADAAAGTRAQPTTRTTTCVVRSLSTSPAAPPAAPAAQRQESTMDEVQERSAAGTQAADIKLVQDQAREAETARVRDISAVGEQFNQREKATEFVRAGKSAAEFREFVLEEIRKQNATQVQATRDIGMTDAEVRKYSINRAIAAMLAEGEGKRDAWKDAGFEREASEAVMKKRGIEPQNSGFFVPWDVQARQLMPRNIRELATRDPWALERLVRDIQSRDLTVAGATVGATLVGTDHLPGSFIDMLRAEMVMMSLGVRVLDGLVGQVSIPRQTAASGMFYPANEGAVIAESNPTFNALALTAKHAGVYVQISRALMMQSSPAADALTVADIQAQIGLGIDTAIYAGSGGVQPAGLTGFAGIGAVVGTSIANAGIVEFQTDVGTANGLNESAAYLTTPAVAGLLMQRQRFASTDTPLWTGTVREGMLGGYPARASTIVTAGTMAFGSWNQIILAMWGDLEIARDPFAVFQSGVAGIRGFVSFDVGIRQAGAFSQAVSIT